MTVLTMVTLRSSNKKTGPMAVTSREQRSCPVGCPFYSNGCYATGRIFAMPRKHGRPDVEAVRALVDHPLPHGLRLNVSGDFLAEDGSPDLEYIDACNAVADAHPGKTIIAYTHAWRELDRSLFRFNVNASCETEEDVRAAYAAGWQAVIVNGELGSDIDGHRVVRCPAETRDEVTCASCGACGADTRTRPVISFTAHGAGKGRASAAVQDRRQLQLV